MNYDQMDDMAEHAVSVRTGWPAQGRLVQDDSRELSRALSKDPTAPLHVRQLCREIEEAKKINIASGEDAGEWW